MTKPTLVALSGSLRKDASNSKLLREAARLFGDCTFIEADLNLPLYNGDDEDRDGVPAAVEALARQIAEADGVLISTPEYNAGVSGVLKNALDWISRAETKPWVRKPVAVMSAAAGRAGGVQGQNMLRACLTNFRPRIALGPAVMLADSNKQFDEYGQLTSAQYEKSLGDLMAALRADIG